MPTDKQSKILMVYIEPTPYIVGLINILQQRWHGEIDILFLGENLSQSWNLKKDKKWMIMPKKRSEKLRFIMNLLRKNHYKVIHLSGWGESLCLLFIILAKLCQISVVVESDTPIPYQTKRWKRIIKRLCYPRLFSFVNLFLPGGKRQAKYIEYYGVESERIIPIQMTVDINDIQQSIEKLTSQDRQRIRNDYGIPENNIIFLFVGRLNIRKGVVDLITAFGHVKNVNVTLLIVGDGDLRQQIEEVVKVDKRICYAGRLSDEALKESYFIADVLILPSHFEPWGLVVNEAMAVGRPVIVSDRVGCIDDLITEQETGWIVKAEYVSELKMTIEKIINAPHQFEIMGKKMHPSDCKLDLGKFSK